MKRTTLLSFLLTSTAACGASVTPVPDSPLRFTAAGTLRTSTTPCSVTVRVEDLGSKGAPNHDPLYRNRWHYVVYGCAMPTVKDLWTSVTVSCRPGEVVLDVVAWGSLRYVPLDAALRPDFTVSETNWQKVTITELDSLTYDILIEEPECSTQL